MKASEQYFPVVLTVFYAVWVSIVRHSCSTVYFAVKVVLTFESVDEILKRDHSIESY